MSPMPPRTTNSRILFMRGDRSFAQATGTSRFKEQNVYMPPFGAAYSDAELAAVANYVIAHFGGKTGRVAPQDVAKRRQE